MRDFDDTADFEGAARRGFAALVRQTLPAAARARGWPVSAPEEFERLLLDHALGAPWESAIGRPAAEKAALLDLVLALEVGARLLEGRVCVTQLNRRSLALRAPRGSEAAACRSCDPAVASREAAGLREARAAGRKKRRGR